MIVATSAWARSSVVPGLTRAKAWYPRACRFSRIAGRERKGQAEAGMYTSFSSG